MQGFLFSLSFAWALLQDLLVEVCDNDREARQ